MNKKIFGVVFLGSIGVFGNAMALDDNCTKFVNYQVAALKFVADQKKVTPNLVKIDPEKLTYSEVELLRKTHDDCEVKAVLLNQVMIKK